MIISNRQSIRSSVGTINIVSGAEVFTLFTDAGFLAKWDSLYLSCPWSTVFQSSKFITTWFQIYEQRFSPIIVYALEDEEMIGLLPLTINKNLLVGAGHFDAEYQVWLATSYDQNWFIKSSLEELNRKYPHYNLELKYVPKETPIEWAKSEKYWKSCCVVGERLRPLIQLDYEAISRELRKKNRKEKLNRLKRKGNLNFEQIKDRNVFAAIFDELATQYDFRQGARFDKTNFKHNPLKKKLLLALFEQNLLHVTLLKIDDEIIATNLSIIGNKWVYLKGMNSYAPKYGKYSPGILHLLMLCQQLSMEELEVFDLTPGDDPYKDVLANNRDHVYELMVTNSAGQFLKWNHIKNILRSLVYTSLIRNGIKPITLTQLLARKYNQYQEQYKRAKKQGSISLIFEKLQTKKTKDCHWIFERGNSSSENNAPLMVQKDSLSDLLSYNDDLMIQTRWGFLKEAMHRFEEGQHVYTYSENGQLMHCVWLTGVMHDTSNYKHHHTSTIAYYDAVLESFTCHPYARESFTAFLQTVTDTVLSERKTNQIVAKIFGKDAVFHQQLKTAGFKQII